MEDNQVVTNGDPLKDLYNEFNPKLNLSKSYDEFKSFMQDPANRKSFYDEFNPKLNLSKSYNEFEDYIGLKKKDGGTTSTSSATISPSSVPNQVSKTNDYTLSDGTQMSNIKPSVSQQGDNNAFSVNKSLDKINALKSKIDSYNAISEKSRLTDDDKRKLRKLNGELGLHLGSIGVREQTKSVNPEAYNESINRYNDTTQKLNSFLSKKGGLTPKQIEDYKNTVNEYNQEVGKINDYSNNQSNIDTDPIALAKQANELSKATKKQQVQGFGGSVSETDVPDTEKIQQSNKIKDYLKSKGFDEDFINQVSDLPKGIENIKGYTNKDLLEQYKNNPTLFNRTVASAKWQSPLSAAMTTAEQAIDNDTNLTKEEKDNKKQEIEADRNLMLSGQSGTLENGQLKGSQYKQQETENAINLVHKYIDNQKDQDNIIKNLVTDKSVTFGSDESYTKNKNFPLMGLTPEQSLGLDFLSTTNKRQFLGFQKYLNVDPKKVAKDYETKLGYDEKLKQLEEIGNTLLFKQAKENFDRLIYLSKTQDLTPEQQASLSHYQEKMSQAKQNLDNLDLKYPELAKYSNDMMAQDLVGQRTSGLDFAKQALGEATLKTGQNLYDLGASLFRNEREQNMAELKALGQTTEMEPSTYVRQGNRQIQDYKYVLTKDLQEKIDAIKNSNYSQQEKLAMASKLISENKDKITRESLNGKFNIGINSLYYGVSKLAADLTPYIAAETLTGGGATAGVARKFASTFASVLMTSFDDELAKAVKNNDPNPQLAAYTNVGINAIAFTVGGIPEKIKAAAGTKTAMGQMINRLTDDEILKALRNNPETLRSFMDKVGEGLASSAKESTISALKMQPILGASQLIQGADFDDKFAKEQVINALNFSLFGTLTSAIPEYNKIKDATKESLYLAGKNSEEALQILNDKIKDGNISKSDADQIKANIEKAKKVYEKVPMVDAKGKPLSDNDAKELMFLKMQESDLEDTLKKDIPKSLTTTVLKKLSDVQDKIDSVYKGTLIDEQKQVSKKLTKEAEYLLQSLDKGSYPEFIDRNLKSIAEENGITGIEEGKTRVVDVVDALREKKEKGLAEVHIPEQTKEVVSEEKIPEREHRIGDEVNVKDFDGNVIFPNVKITGISPDGKYIHTNVDGLASVPIENIEKPKIEEPILPKHQEIGNQILSHVGISPTPEAAKVYDINNLNSIDTNGLDETQKKVVGDVSNVVKSISKLVDKSTGQNLTVTLHSSPKTYAEAVVAAGGTKQDATSKGFYLDTNGQIHLNMARVTPETMLHEGFHPVLDYMAKHNPNIIDKFYFQLTKLEGGREIIDRAIENYDGDITQKKEAITDYIAKVANGDIELNRTTFEKIKDWILDTLKTLGLPIDRKIESIKDIQDLAKNISEKFAAGEEIKISAKNYAEKASSNIPTEGVDIESVIDTYTDRSPQFSKKKEEGWLTDADIVKVNELKGKKVSRVVFYDNTRVGKFEVKNRITGYTPNREGKGGFGYSFKPEMAANKMVLAFTSVNQAIQTIKRHMRNPESLLGVAMQNQLTAHLGNLDTNALLFGLKENGDEGIFQNAAKTIGVKGLTGLEKKQKIKDNENKILSIIKKSIFDLADKNGKQSADLKKVIGNLDNIKTLDEFQNKFLLGDANSFGLRGFILNDLLQEKATKVTKGTRDSHKILHYEFGIPTLSELAEGVNDKHFANAELGDVVKYIKPYDDPIIFITDKKMFDELSKKPTPEMKANNIKLELLPEDLSHPSYPVVIKGDNIGIGDKYISAVDLFPKFKEEGLSKSGSFFKVGRMKADAEMGEIPESAEAQGVAQFSKENSLDKKLQSAIDFQREAGASEEDIRKGLESVKEHLGISDEDIDRLMTPKQVVEPKQETTINPTEQKRDGTLISKAGLKESEYPFSKEFDERGGQQVATDMLKHIKTQASKNGITIEAQLARKVASMKGKNNHPTEYNIISAGTHLLNLDKQIREAIASGQNVDNLIQERDETAAVLRNLGNNAGRNLGLFNLVFKDANASEISVYANNIKRTLGIPTIAVSIAELNSKLNSGEINQYDFAKAYPYVEKIEGLRKDMDKAESEFEQRAKDFRKQDEEEALKKAYEQGKEDALNSKRPVLERKGSKDLANRLRGLKINKGGEASKPSNGPTQFSKDVTTPKEELWGKRINDIAALVEDGKSIKEAIAQLISEGKLGENDQVGVEQFIAKTIQAEDALGNLKTFVDNGDKTITQDMVKNGVIRDIVEGVLHSGISYDKVLDEATNQLKEYLPEVTRDMVSDAYLRKGDFALESRNKLNKDIEDKRNQVKTLARKEAIVAAHEGAAIFHTTPNKLDRNKIVSEKEKEYNRRIKELKDARRQIENTNKRIADLETQLSNLQNNIKQEKDPAKKKEYFGKEKELRDKIADEKKRIFGENKAEDEARKRDERIKNLRSEISDLEKGIRKKKVPGNKTEYVGEEKDLIEKRNKLSKALAKEERAANRFYKESDSGNTRLEKMADELDRLTNRREKEDNQNTEELTEPQKELRRKIDELQKKIDAERHAWNTEKAIKKINEEQQYVELNHKVFRKAIKNKKEAEAGLKAANESLNKAYSEAGLRRETQEVQPIAVERAYQEEVDKVKNDTSLSDEERKNKLEDLKSKRESDLSGTKQGVISNLSDSINDLLDTVKNDIIKTNALQDENGNYKSNEQIIEDNKRITYLDEKVRKPLASILSELDPSGENLVDMANKAHGMLKKLLEDKSLSEEDKVSIKKIIRDFENDSLLTYNQLAAKRLKAQWEAEIKAKETKINSGEFHEMPENSYDFRTNENLMLLNAERQKITGKLKNLANEAKEKNKNSFDKAIDLSSKLLVSGVHTAAKVAEAGSFKPFMDATVELSTGNLISKLTQTGGSSFADVGQGIKALAAFKNRESALKYIKNLEVEKNKALENLSKVKQGGSEAAIKKANDEYLKAELNYAVSSAYKVIDANSLKTFMDYIIHSSTEYDAIMGKGEKKNFKDLQSNLEKTGYVLDGWIRVHSALKTSLSARQAFMRSFSSTLAEFQKEGRPLNDESISLAMIIAHNSYEEGKLTNKTELSKAITGLKNHEKAWIRMPSNVIFPVSTIAFNIAKRGFDYSSLGAEGWVRLAKGAKEGMRLNEAEGKEYDGWWKSVKDGISRMPLEERKYINGVISRGLFGAAIFGVTLIGLTNGQIKYGGTYEDQKKRKIMGSDKQPLGPNEWEFFGHRMGKLGNAFLNHLPEFMPIALAANHYQIGKLEGSYIFNSNAMYADLQEIEARLPFQTLLGLAQPGMIGKTLVDRFTRVPIASDIGSYFDKYSEERDKSNSLNRFRSNIGAGAFNPSKEQQKQLDALDKMIIKARANVTSKEELDYINSEEKRRKEIIMKEPIIVKPKK